MFANLSWMISLMILHIKGRSFMFGNRNSLDIHTNFFFVLLGNIHTNSCLVFGTGFTPHGLVLSELIRSDLTFKLMIQIKKRKNLTVHNRFFFLPI